jgi:hypothetical protein
MAVTGPWRNSADLIDAVLARIGVKQVGQATDPEDVAYVSVELDSIFRKYAMLNVFAVYNLNEIRAEWFKEIVRVVAGEVAEKFGVNDEAFVRLEAGKEDAVKTLREMNRGRPTGERLRVEYL